MPTLPQIDAMILRAYHRLRGTRRNGTPALIELQEATLDALLDQRLAMMEKRQ